MAPHKTRAILQDSGLTTLEFPKIEAELLRSLKPLMQPSREGRHFGLLCVQVDASEAVDALLGTDGVTRLLTEAFNRLRGCVRTTDIVSTGHASSFFILATDLQSEDELEIISDRIQRTCRQPYWIHDQEIRSGLTTGAVGGSDAAGDPALLTRHAVLAMRRAAGRGVPFEFFNPPNSTPQIRSPASSVPSAPAESPFELIFHPQFTRDHAVCGIRAGVLLPRAPGRKRLDQPAGEQLSSKNASGKTARIDDLVLRRLLLQASAWTDGGLTVPPISIEIGANHLLNPTFAGSLLQLLEETRTPGEAIDLLLSEATTLTSLGSAQRTLAELRQAGVRFGLSGFSLNAGSRIDLRKLPFSSLRVSCTSLFKATSPRESLWLARSIVGVATRCGLTFIGEDVRTEAQRDTLVEGGCERFEGVLFSQPVSATAMQALLHPKS